MSTAETNEVIHQIPLTDLQPYPHQTREHFDKKELQQLADDILKRGIRSPLEYFIDEEGNSTILTGERRYRAAKLANLETAPCILRERTDFLEQIFDHASENLQRSDLNALEMANFFQALISKGKIKLSDLPEELVKHGFQKYDRSYISNTLRLLKLPAWMKTLIRQKKMTAAHGKYLVPALASKAVTKHIQAFLKKPCSTRKLQEAIERAYDDLHIDVCSGRSVLDKEGGFNRWQNTKFNWKEECKDCSTRHALSTEHSTTLYCLNEPCYVEKQQAALIKIEKAEQRKIKTAETKRKNALAKKADTAGVSVEEIEAQETSPMDNSRKRGRIERTQAYLDEWLRKQIDAHLLKDQATRYLIILWMAAGAPGESYYGTSAAGSVHLEFDQSIKDHGINITLQEKIDTTQLELMTCTAGINTMTRENLRTLSHFIGIKLEGNYTIDLEYLNIKQKDEVIETTPEAVIQSWDEGYWEKLCKKPASFLKDQIQNKDYLYGVPADLQEMYNETEA